MNGIELLEAEHQNIKILVKVFKQACLKGIETGRVNTQDFRDMATFAKNYADKTHHGKEEKILFREMLIHGGAMAENLIKHGMLVEHDLGRLFMSELRSALDQYDETGSAEARLEIIANADGWANHLTRHMEKEDDAVYKYAARKLPVESLAKVDSETETFEQSVVEEKAELLEILDRLVIKYGVER